MRAQAAAIHTDRDGRSDEARITVFDSDEGRLVVPGTRKLILRGTWTLRQYNNPVPCGATTVLFTTDPNATWEEA